MRRVLLIAVVAGLLLLALPAFALAAKRYASPTGSSGDPCNASQPCDIATAIYGTAVNYPNPRDEVIVEPGTYSVGTTLHDGTNLVIHGVDGQPPPRLVFTGNAGFVVQFPDTSVRYLDIEDDGTATAPGPVLELLNKNVGEQLIVYSSSPNRNVCGVAGVPTTPSLLRNSVCWTSAANAMALDISASFSSSGVIRNVTAWASAANSVGMYVSASSGATVTLSATNTIVHGTANDVYVHTADSTSSASATLDHSNYATATASGTGASVTPAGPGPPMMNQTAAPHLANPTAGDFHELASSPTIDKGANDPANGSSDLDGHPRHQGAATDIGAYEFAPPLPSPRCVVPKLKGKTLKNARKLLIAGDCLRLGKVKKPKHHKGKLVVKSQTPNPGTVLPLDSSVSVKLGPKAHHKKRH